jgi:hypothetical protein
MASDKRRRLQIRFWLNDGKPSESSIGAWLDKLKSSRKMKPTIFRALQLYKALLTGDTQLLAKMFPDVVSKIEQEHEVKKDSDIGQEVVALMAQQTQIMQQLSERLN